MLSDDLRVGLIGAGRMGADHAQRLHERISGARLTAIADPDSARGTEVASAIPGCRADTEPSGIIADPAVDAVVIASPGPAHEPLLLTALDRGIPVLCEKPLTPDSVSARRIVEAEATGGRKLIQVGFMRRFDSEYGELKRLLDSEEHGRPLMLHCAHRNAFSPPGFTTEMVINDSVVHEFDTTRWLLDDEIATVTVRHPRQSRGSPRTVSDPQLVTIETLGGVLVTVEIFVNCGYGYQVRCEAVCERGTAMVGDSAGMIQHTGGRWGGNVPTDFRPRFRHAFDTEFQRWVEAARTGDIAGASAWDGYANAAACEAGVRAQRHGSAEVELMECPALYR